MKRRLRMAAVVVLALLVSFALPFRRSDVAQLVPVEALVISLDEGRIILDGGVCQGSGDSWAAAWEDFLSAGDGIVFLGTTEYLVLAGGAVTHLSDAVQTDMLRPAAKIFLALGDVPDAKETAKYLAAHDSSTTLLRIKSALMQNEAVSLPVLMKTERGLRLYEPEHG